MHRDLFKFQKRVVIDVVQVQQRKHSRIRVLGRDAVPVRRC